ncbi:hypothetical protein STEG23_014628 [Scotinomys teguina]
MLVPKDWMPEQCRLVLKVWRIIGLQSRLQDLANKNKDTLITDRVKVVEQLAEAEQSLEKIQEEEVRKSVSATDTQSEDEEEIQFKTKAKKVKVKEFSSSSSSESDLEEEERLEQEIVDLEMKLKKCWNFPSSAFCMTGFVDRYYFMEYYAYSIYGD